jgi:hypothetical protein
MITAFSSTRDRQKGFCSTECKDAWEAQDVWKAQQKAASGSSTGSGSSNDGGSESSSSSGDESSDDEYDSSSSGGGGSFMGAMGSIMASSMQTSLQTSLKYVHDQEAEREGRAAVQAIRFDGDAKSIMNSLGNLQSIIATPNARGLSAMAIRKAAFEKFEFGVRALRGTGDTANTEYFEKKLKSMKRKAFFTSPIFMWLCFFVVFVILFTILLKYGIEQGW